MKSIIKPRCAMSIDKNHKRQATMKDVAERVNVSTATVSYVLNYSDKKKISHETRLKVFKAAEELNYITDKSARSLALRRYSDVKHEKGTVGLIVDIDEHSSWTKRSIYYELFNLLAAGLKQSGYELVEILYKNVDQALKEKHDYDLILLYELTLEDAQALTQEFFVPVASIETPLFNILFHEVNFDFLHLFEDLSEKAKYLCIEDYVNDRVYEIASKFINQDNILVNASEESLELFLDKENIQDEKIIVVGEALALKVRRFVDEKQMIVVCYSESGTNLFPHSEVLLFDLNKIVKETCFLVEKLLELKGREVDHIIYIPAEMVKNK